VARDTWDMNVWRRSEDTQHPAHSSRCSLVPGHNGKRRAIESLSTQRRTHPLPPRDLTPITTTAAATPLPNLDVSSIRAVPSSAMPRRSVRCPRRSHRSSPCQSINQLPYAKPQ